MAYPEILASGDLRVAPRVVVPADELAVRVTTPGGPGGQHANRTQSRVIVTWSIVHSAALSERSRSVLLEAFGNSVSASASASRSQARNRQDALERLAAKIASALVERPSRRSTKPTRASVERRLNEKKLRARTKSTRRTRGDDD